jgi:hypothetical protein
MAQVGKWLAETIGEGAVFTKHELRATFPQYEQADRRMRDLRNHGWRIDTNREDASLRSNELRLVKIGSAVWSPSFHPSTMPRVSPKDRLAAISDAGFQCQFCGAQLGAASADDASLIRLRVVSVSRGIAVACQQCAGGVASFLDRSLAQLEGKLKSLGPEELRYFESRAQAKDYQSPVEAALVLASRLPVQAVKELLEADLE